MHIHFKKINKPFKSVLLAALLAGCSHDVKVLDSADIDKLNADKFLIVDCLLPSSVRQLGTRVTYLGPRRVIKTSAIDCQIRGGEYVAADRANYQTALKVWLPQAQAGDAKAQVYVGEIYEKGLGIEPDYAKAAQWYEKAAAQGNERAKLNLGFLYEKGLGVKKNKVKALSLYRDASGLTSGKLEYVSSEQQRERATARLSLQDALQQAEQANKALQNSQRSVQNLQKEIAELNRRLTSDSYKTPNEQARIKQEISSKQKIVEQGRDRIQAARVDIREARQVVKHQGENTKNQGSKPLVIASKGAPTIEITYPAISALRSTGGKPKVPLPSSDTVVKGKLSPVNEIQSLKINNQTVKFDKNGAFSFPVSVKNEEADINILAENKTGKRAKFGFILIPGGDVEAAIEQGKTGTQQTVDLSSLKGINFGKYYALVIGNDAYEDMPPLKSSVNDATAVANTLATRYGFTSLLVKNANKAKMLAVLESLRKKLTENDNLVIYYAGHGEIDKDQKGYWLPVDATQDKASWLPNRRITDMLDAIPAKHILVVADSCYSGTMSGSAVPRPVSGVTRQAAWYRQIMENKVRVVLSSGGVRPVLDTGGSNDHSVFAAAFLDTLRDNSTLMEASALYHALRPKVEAAARKQGIEQIPRFAPIQFTGHSAGDFVLLGNNKSVTWHSEYPFDPTNPPENDRARMLVVGLSVSEASSHFDIELG